MSVANCLTRIKSYVKDSGLVETVTNARLEYFAERLSAIQGESMSGAEFAANAQAMLGEMEMRDNAKRQASNAQILYKRNNVARAIRENIAAWQADVDKGRFGKREAMPTEAFSAWQIGGATRSGEGTNLSVPHMRNAVKMQLLKLLNQGLRKVEGLKEAALSGALDKNALIELAAIDNGTTKGLTKDTLALEYAKVLKSVRDGIFEKKQAINPYMEGAQDYLWKQMHDPDRIEKMGKTEWTKMIMDKAGDKSFPDQGAAGKISKFGEMYDKIVSRQWGSIADESNSDKMLIQRGNRNIEGSMAASRQIKFNSPESFADYNSVAGPKTLFDGMQRITGTAANDIALLNKAGPNPDGFREGMLKRIENGLKGADKEQFKADRPRLDKEWAVIKGAQNAKAKGWQARTAQGLMNLQAMTKSGMSVFRSTQDSAMGASLLRNLDGSNIASHTLDLVGTFAKAFANPEFRNQQLENLGIFSNAAHLEEMRRMGDSQAGPGMMSKMAQLMGSLNGHNNALDSHGVGIATALTRIAGRETGLRHSELTPQWQAGLARYGIDAPMWNAMRLGTEQINGTTRLTPDGVANLPDAAAENYLRNSGQHVSAANPTARALDHARDQMNLAYGAMINEHAQLTSARPDVRQRSFMFGDTNINQGMGQLRRMLWEFKAAGLTQSDVYRRAYFSGTTPVGALSGVAQTAVMSSFLFMLGDMAKTMIQGKKPEDPRDPAYLVKMAVGSGMAGTFADTMINAVNSVSERSPSPTADLTKNLAKNAVGPALGNIYDVGSSLYGAATGAKDAKKFGMKTALSMVPYQNLPYTKGLFDYYLKDRLMQFVGPGYMNSLGHAHGQKSLFGK